MRTNALMRLNGKSPVVMVPWSLRSVGQKEYLSRKGGEHIGSIMVRNMPSSIARAIKLKILDAKTLHSVYFDMEIVRLPRFTPHSRLSEKPRTIPSLSSRLSGAERGAEAEVMHLRRQIRTHIVRIWHGIYQNFSQGQEIVTCVTFCFCAQPGVL